MDQRQRDHSDLQGQQQAQHEALQQEVCRNSKLKRTKHALSGGEANIHLRVCQRASSVESKEAELDALNAAKMAQSDDLYDFQCKADALSRAVHEEVDVIETISQQMTELFDRIFDTSSKHTVALSDVSAVRF